MMYQPFKSATQPLCRACGKPIAKDTVSVYVKETHSEYDDVERRLSSHIRYAYGVCKSKADCQRHSNMQVVSVEYHRYASEDEGELRSRVRRFTEWDGETYRHPFFCTNNCAIDFGLLAARLGKLTTQAYADAMLKRRKKEDQT